MVETKSGEKELPIVPRKKNWGRFAWLPNPAYTLNPNYDPDEKATAKQPAAKRPSPEEFLRKRDKDGKLTLEELKN